MRRNTWKSLNWLTALARSRKTTSPAHHRRLRYELLEDRQLLSAVVVNGSNGPDTITTECVGGQLQVTINGASTGYADATGLTINGLGGNDTIEVKNLPFGATVDGGDGDDTIGVRNGQADTVFGGAGYDAVSIESYDVELQAEWVNPYTPARENQPMHVKVLVMNFAPHVPSQGNQLLWQTFGWTDPRVLAADYSATMERTSGGLIDMDIVDWLDVDSLVPRADGYVYSADEYYNIWSTTRRFHQPDTADNARLMNDYGVPLRVASGEIDEVWAFGPPGAGADWEASMLGPRAFFINGGVYPDVASQRPFALYGFNYERGVDCMTENTLHRMENHMARSYGGWNLAAPQTAWDRFTANVAQSPITPGVGDCHYGPNSASDYDWANPRYVSSNADDWLDYPDLTGQTRQINYTAWINGGTRDSFLGHHNWWLEHLPRAPGVNADGRQNNWWKYAYDYDNYDADTGNPKPFRAETTLADVSGFGGTLYDFDVGYADPIPIDVSSLGDGSLVVRGPGGFSQVAHLVGVSDARNGTFRVGHYRLTPPGGSWDATDSGYYSVLLQDGQVRDTAGATLAGQMLGYFHVGTPTDQLSENNAGDWTAWAEGASASVVDDSGVKYAGTSSLKFTTDGGFDTRLKYQLPAGQVWDLQDVPVMAVSLRAEDPSPYGFQNGSPWIRLVDGAGSYYEYQYYRFGAPYDVLNDVRGTWQSFLIPLNPGTPEEGWHRTTVGTPDLADIRSLEIHADTWDFGFTLWVDGVGFEHFAAPNDAPYVNRPIADQTTGANRSFEFTLAADTFVDRDAGQTLSYAATRSDGTALPHWLSFDARTLTFAGRPLVPNAGQVSLRVTATDSGASPLSVAAEFSISVTPYLFPWQNADQSADVDGNGTVVPLDALLLINWINSNGSGVPLNLYPDPAAPLFLDVSGDNYVAPLDVLLVINFLNQHPSGIAEGEMSPDAVSSPARESLPASGQSVLPLPSTTSDTARNMASLSDPRFNQPRSGTVEPARSDHGNVSWNAVHYRRGVFLPRGCQSEPPFDLDAVPGELSVILPEMANGPE
jgi:hypothetical protein